MDSKHSASDANRDSKDAKCEPKQNPRNATLKWGAWWFDAKQERAPQSRMFEHADDQGHSFYVSHETPNGNTINTAKSLRKAGE